MKRVFDYIATCENIDGRALKYISKIHCVVPRLIFLLPNAKPLPNDFQHHYHNNCNEDEINEGTIVLPYMDRGGKLQPSLAIDTSNIFHQ